MEQHNLESINSHQGKTSAASPDDIKNKRWPAPLVVGLILVIFVVLITAGVAALVYFAVENKHVVCECLQTNNDNKNECIKLAAQGNKDICNVCTLPPITYPPLIHHPSTPNPPITSKPHPVTSEVPREIKTTDAAVTERPSIKNYRLPKSVHPIHYDVELQPYMHHPDPHNFTFKGSVRIYIRCDVATDNITLHVDVLTVNISTIRFQPEVSASLGDPHYSGYDVDKDRDFFIVKLNKNMKVGEIYVLDMSFTSPLQNNLLGLYYSSYNSQNKTIYLATTQFEATHARKAFPCFDEPAMKATFSIILVRPLNQTSISNMPIINSSTVLQENGITYVKDVYQKTPKMSTYLLAFVVCDYKYAIRYTKRNVTIRTWAKPDAVNHTLFALTTAVNITDYFEDHFQVQYSMPKQDMIAIPDFVDGAMENWGLITYRDKNMLYEEGVSDVVEKEKVALIVSHELVHQWFGNLVTPNWWNDIWLNEGFATFLQYVGVDKLHPHWKVFDKFAVKVLQYALAIDDNIFSHAVYLPVEAPIEIEKNFDGITYQRAGSIVRMMRHFLGQETFEKGLTNYLRKFSYQSVVHDDLWSVLTKQAHDDNMRHIYVKDIMDTWILQMNYPVVTVTCNHSINHQLHVTQARYLADPTEYNRNQYTPLFGYRWTIPLTFTSSINPRFEQHYQDVYWLHHHETSNIFNIFHHPLPGRNDTNSWILANVQQHGFYRVNYHADNWLALGKQLLVNHTVFPIITRSQLLDDVWNLALSGHANISSALEISDYLHKEKDYVPWSAAEKELKFVDEKLLLTSVHEPFRKFMRAKLTDTFRELGMLNISTGHVNMIDPNFKNLVYCYAIANGGWNEWNFALKMYMKTDDTDEKARLLKAMACTKNYMILAHFLAIIIEENSPISFDDAHTAYYSVANNKFGKDLADQFHMANQETLQNNFWIYRPNKCSDNKPKTVSVNMEAEINKESKSEDLGSVKLAIDQAIENEPSHIKWQKKYISTIAQWLKEKKYM